MKKAKVIDEVFEVNIADVKDNPANPRIIRDAQFLKLLKSLREFPEMASKRPIICVTDTDGKYMPIGGNQRLKGHRELNHKTVFIMLADEWTEEQRDQFVVKDNAHFGEWDLTKLGAFQMENLGEWGVVTWEDTSGHTEEPESTRKQKHRRISLQFKEEDYKSALDVIEFWKEKGLDVGAFLVEKLKERKA